MSHPAGTIVLPVADIIRYPQFVYSLTTLQQPPDTNLSIIRSASIADNLNAAVKDLHGEWLWQIADDHVFAHDLLLALLDHEVDIVAPVCFTRAPPFTPVIYTEHGTHQWDGREYPGYLPRGLHEFPKKGLVEVQACGGAGMLIRKHVFDAIGSPWFEDTAGSVANNDLEFCRKAREHGFKVLVDCAARLGHVGNFTIWPEHRNGKSGFLLDFGNGKDEVFAGVDNAS